MTEMTSGYLLRILMMLCVVVISSNVNAHPLAPYVLKLNITNTHDLNVSWKEPEIQPTGLAIAPIFPEHCSLTRPISTTRISGAMHYNWALNCKKGIYGSTILIEGFRQSGALLYYEQQNPGSALIRNLYDDAQSNITIDQPQAKDFWQATWLFQGVLHLLKGIDHVLLVVGLVFLLRKQAFKLFAAITGFTIGHSVTLVLVSLKTVEVNTLLVELCISATILWMGLEVLLTGRSAYQSIIVRSIFLVPIAIGLIHGMGFASVYQQIAGDHGSLWDILLFNLGIELGQLIIVSLVLLVSFTISSLSFSRDRSGGQWIGKWLGYGIGSSAIYLMWNIVLG